MRDIMKKHDRLHSFDHSDGIDGTPSPDELGTDSGFDELSLSGYPSHRNEINDIYDGMSNKIDYKKRIEKIIKLRVATIMSMVAIMEINEREESAFNDDNDDNKMDDEIDVIHDDSDEEFPKKPPLRRQNEINTGWFSNPFKRNKPKLQKQQSMRNLNVNIEDEPIIRKLAYIMTSDLSNSNTFSKPQYSNNNPLPIPSSITDNPLPIKPNKSLFSIPQWICIGIVLVILSLIYSIYVDCPSKNANDTPFCNETLKIMKAILELSRDFFDLLVSFLLK